MKMQSAVLFMSLLIASGQAYSHGEDRPGPHGGYIRMPGAFHTEVVKENKGYRVYLLDINWKNPSVLDSSISASILTGKEKISLVCQKEAESYYCNSTLSKKGELNIIAKREGQSGGVSSYSLPLKFEIPKKETSEHSDHQRQGH